MGLTAKFGQTKDLVVVLVSGTKKAPAGCRGFSDLYFYYRGLTITKNHFWGSFILLMGFGLLVFGGVWGLDMRFC
jgi:hypothetical protein